MASRAFTDILTTASSSRCGLTILAGVATRQCEVMAAGNYKGRPVCIDATHIKRLSGELGSAAIAERLHQ
jgi:hypothetical protein